MIDHYALTGVCVYFFPQAVPCHSPCHSWAAMIRVLRDVFVSLHMERPLKQSSSRPEPFEWRCLKKVELARWNIGPGRHFMLDVPEGGMSHRHVHATFFCLCSVSTDCCAYCMSVIVAVPSAHLTLGGPTPAEDTA